MKPTYFCWCYYFLIKMFNNFLARSSILQKFDYFPQWYELILKNPWNIKEAKVRYDENVSCYNRIYGFGFNTRSVLKISCLLSCAHSGSYSAEREVKWEMSWLSEDRFVPPTPSPKHTYTLTHTYSDVNLIWKKSGNIIINFSSYKNDYSCLTALCWNSWNTHFAST